MGAPVPICPRCGYDLTGMIASWMAASPLRSTCTECGLEFDCGHVLSPKAIGPRWSYEHASRDRLRRFVATSWVSLNPWRLTRELLIDHQIRVGRLVVFMMVWVMVPYMGLSVLRVLLAPGMPWGVGGWSQYSFYFWLEWVPTAFWPYGRASVAIGAGWAEIPFLRPLLFFYVPTLLMPLWMLLLGTTMHQASARRVHLLRGLVLTVPGAVLALHGTIALVLVCARALGLGGRLPEVFGVAIIALMAGFSLWLTAWWWLYIKRYLRLPHAPAIALLLMFTSGLALAVIFAVLAAYQYEF